MTDRIRVCGLGSIEESRALAEAISDLHYAIGRLLDHANEFLPGEAIEELRDAWSGSGKKMARLIENLDGQEETYFGEVDGKPVASLDNPRRLPTMTTRELREADLDGASGKIKRNWLGRLRDSFFKFFNSEPRTAETRRNAANAMSNWLALGSTVISSIPGQHVIVEFLSLTKQLIDTRTERGF